MRPWKIITALLSENFSVVVVAVAVVVVIVIVIPTFIVLVVL